MMTQTHFVEARQEIERTKQLFPQFSNEADLYRSFGLFDDHTIMAHCIWPSDYEVGQMLKHNVGVVHCPVSNTTGGEWGAAPVRRYLDLGMKVGLETDSGGGFSSSILDAMRQAIITSNARQTYSDGKEKTLGIAEVFHMGTLGGAKVCSLDDKIGSFAVGKDFDALRIFMSPEVGGVSSVLEEEDSIEDIFEKFVMTGDDRNIVSVYVRGRSVK
jgi:guanine deaminase